MATAFERNWQAAGRFLGLMTLLGPALAACASNPHHHVGRGIFSSRDFGVAVSPRVSHSANPPHGGGRPLVGSPYKVHGQWYTPKANPTGYVVSGTASWYGQDFHGRLTANGEIFNANAISGGSPDLPLPCYAQVTNLDNGRTMLVRFNDRGPYMSGRVIDLSEKAATLLGYVNTGTAHVKVQYVSPAPINGDDTRFLMASLNQATPSFGATTQLAMATPDQIRPLISPQPRPVALFGSRPAARAAGNPRMSEVLNSVNGLFSYSEAQSAQSEIPSLSDWVATTDDDQRGIKLALGTFEDPAAAKETAIQFAMLGAVDEDDVTADSGASVTRLTLTHLKPGVAREDVLDLVHKLGLKDVVLY